MTSKVAKIHFYFPNASERVATKKQLVATILHTMKKDGNTQYAGYAKEKNLEHDILAYLGSGKPGRNLSITPAQKESIQATVFETLRKCQGALPHPNPPIFIFVYPWIPDSETRRQFGGATGFASYYTLHLFIDPNQISQRSIAETVAHEWNHLVYYRYHDQSKRTLLDQMIIEGLAEIFREELLGGRHAPWSLALSERETVGQKNALTGSLESTSANLYRAVFFGSKKFRRWTGYSIGYRAAAAYRQNHKKSAWIKIIKTDPRTVFFYKKK